MNSNKFYGILKKRNFNDDDEKDQMKVAILNFY